MAEEQNEITPKYTIKDSVFTHLFKEKPYLLQLYQTLHPEDIDATVDDLKTITIENILVDKSYNDLGFMVNDKLIILVEAQSTWTPNIIIRSLLYLARTYHEYFKATKQNLYKNKPVFVLRPELYVIYTGNRVKKPEVMTLTDEFFRGDRTDIEVRVHIIYENGKDDIINQYILFAKLYNTQVKLYGMTLKALEETIRICKNKDILSDYLTRREVEIVDIYKTLFDQEEVLKDYMESRDFDVAIKTTVEILKSLNFTYDEIVLKTMEKFNLSKWWAEEKVQEFWNEN